MRTPRLNAGFTMVEMIMVIVLIGIVSAALAPFMGAAVDAYQANRARADLVTLGRLSLERLTREIRHAVPNTLRVVATAPDPDNGALTVGTGIEFLRAKGGGRYVEQGHPFGTAFRRVARQFRIDPPAMTELYVLGDTGVATAGDILVVGNTSPADLAGTAVTITSVTVTDPDPLADNTSAGRIFGFAPHLFTRSSPARAYAIADRTVEVGLHGDGSLRWHSGAGLTGYDGAADWGNGDAMLVKGVDRVHFVYAPGTPHASAVLRIDLRLREGEEIIRLYQEVQVRNTP
jgi:MSHA biogenesis protein MshO